MKNFPRGKPPDPVSACFTHTLFRPLNMNFIPTRLQKESSLEQLPNSLCHSILVFIIALLFFPFFQGAFYALRPEDLWRRPDVFVGVAASFCQ